MRTSVPYGDGGAVMMFDDVLALGIHLLQHRDRVSYRARKW
jgi:hypothetical protein